MKFALVDRIVELTPGERIVTVKAVSLAEEYLADHFPSFPVLPGVLMLETLAESAAWLVRQFQNFSNSVILLSEAKNVTYKSFIRPGELLRAEVNCRRLASGDSDFQGVGRCGDREVVKARFSLKHYCLGESNSALADVDAQLITQARERFALILDSVDISAQTKTAT